MDYIALKTAVAIGIISTIYFIAKKKKIKKDLSMLNSDNPDVIEQNKKNTEFIAKIIKGNFFEIKPPVQTKYIKAFDDWQITQGKIFREASSAQRKIFNEYMKKGHKYGFKGKVKEAPPDDSYQLVMGNCFTEPFPSIHDMDTWALNNLIVQFMVLEIIEPFKSENYHIHLKMHFTNHDMVQAIMMVDLYKKK